MPIGDVIFTSFQTISLISWNLGGEYFGQRISGDIWRIRFQTIPVLLQADAAALMA